MLTSMTKRNFPQTLLLLAAASLNGYAQESVQIVKLSPADENTHSVLKRDWSPM